MQEIPIELPDALWLKNHFADYANPKAKIGRLVRQGALHRLKKGLYVSTKAAQDSNVLGKAANRLYGPSYVSFVYALRWYGMIPEHVPHITSATFHKGRMKRYDTPVGSFFYQDVPINAYPQRVVFAGENEKRFLMASPEKALCDELYRISGIRSIRSIESLLFENLRLDREEFERLDHEMLMNLAELYRTATLATLIKLLNRSGND